MCKPLIYYDKMCPPTYIRLVSERLNLDHIIYTEATEKPVGMEEIQVLACSGLFDKILVYGNSSFFIRHPKGSVPESEEISYLDNIWLSINDFLFESSINENDKS